MPRSRSRPAPRSAARASSASRSRPAATPSYSAPPPAPHSTAPPPAPQRQYAASGMGSGLMGAVAQGAALGTGSAIAHRAVGAMFGSGASHEPAEAPQQPPAPVPTNAQDSCGYQMKQFSECMSTRFGDIDACKQYFDAMQQCRAAHGLV